MRTIRSKSGGPHRAGSIFGIVEVGGSCCSVHSLGGAAAPPYQAGAQRRARPTERGTALMVTLVVGSIIGIMLASFLALVQFQNRAVLRAEAWNCEIPLAEAGIEEAMSQWYYSRTNLSANGWTLINNAYTKQRTLPNGRYVVAISNVSPPVVYSQGYALEPGTTNYMTKPRTVRVTIGTRGMFGKGMVAKGRIDLSGNDLKSDSFNSTDPAYSTNGSYDPAKARDNGDIGTNDTVTNAIAVGNANIYGHAATGPGGTVTVGPNGAVGSWVWQNAGNKGFEPGYVTSDMNVSFPDVTVPFTSGSTPSGGTVDGTNYTYVLGSGNYVVASLKLSGQKDVCVNGNAALYVTGDVSISGGVCIYIKPNCRLDLYVGGAADLSGDGIVNANASATNLFYWGLNSNTSLKFSGNSAFVGVVYAPYAAFTLAGGGNPNATYDFIGASVTASVTLKGHYSFHYDEMLGGLDLMGMPVITSWNEI